MVQMKLTFFGVGPAENPRTTCEVTEEACGREFERDTIAGNSSEQTPSDKKRFSPSSNSSPCKLGIGACCEDCDKTAGDCGEGCGRIPSVRETFSMSS
jgi:hypothetical protein